MRITTRNSTFQQLASLRTNRQKRSSTRTFLLEGVRPLNMALSHGWQIQALVHPDGTRLSKWADGILANHAGLTRYAMSPALMAELSAKDEGSELLAVVAMRAPSLAQIPLRPQLLIVVADRPANPGNLGTLIRSCDAFGADALVVTGHAVDLYDPATVTASRGSLFALPVVRLASHRELLDWVASVRRVLGTCRVAGADESATVNAEEHDFTMPTVLVVGNEASGLSQAYRERCDVLLRIPMSGAASSLNVSVAASVLLYEAGRQRRRARHGRGTLDDESSDPGPTFSPN
jgi:TrmH family RNA methyltransferase